jgi:hypothetical protein
MWTYTTNYIRIERVASILHTLFIIVPKPGLKFWETRIKNWLLGGDACGAGDST